MTRRDLMLITALLLGVVASALAADVVEDWSTQPVGTKGIPPPWQKQRWGSPAYDFTVVEDGGRKGLHLKSAGDSSNISKEIKGKVTLKETPILEWSWKVVTLPKGGDSRRKETDDQAAQIYVTWPRFPEAVRSRIIGYIWDTTAPAGAIVKSQKTGTVTYVVVRSGAADLGKWITERRNVREDFKQIYGEEPEDPGVISFGIDSDDTKSTAESFMGPILFRKP
ncbi:MAG: DUF3047 domain-containing protein [Candidatus Rokubacteria bacterium]|nr:DUF3047 domain-containing protein [Candidatus Rokubacteria bacterium]